MKERPILFSVEMVKAILKGQKTQTRRVVVPEKRLDLSPYGQVGDCLWVREKFFVQDFLWKRDHEPQPIEYAADISHSDHVEDYIQRPSIFMPRWASRITLEITSIGVERLCDITEADAIAEGFEEWRRDDDCPQYYSARQCFSIGWDLLNTQRGFGWDTNPQVYVIKFNRIDEVGK